MLNRELENAELVRLPLPNRELENAALLKPRLEAKLEFVVLELLNPERPSIPESAWFVDMADKDREDDAVAPGERVVADMDGELVGARPVVVAGPRELPEAGAPELRATELEGVVAPFVLRFVEALLVPRAAGAAELLRAVDGPERPKYGARAAEEGAEPGRRPYAPFAPYAREPYALPAGGRPP